MNDVSEESSLVEISDSNKGQIVTVKDLVDNKRKRDGIK